MFVVVVEKSSKLVGVPIKSKLVSYIFKVTPVVLYKERVERHIIIDRYRTSTQSHELTECPTLKLALHLKTSW